MTEPYIGQIVQFAFDFAPRYYALAQGQLLSIAQNQALFSILGTTYGGNGVQTFGLPDLRGRTMIGWGQGAGLQNYVIGQAAGTENVTLNTTQMPQHTHTATFTPTTASQTFNATSSKGQSNTPNGNPLLARGIDGAAAPSAKPFIYAPAGTSPTVPLGGVNVAGTITVANQGGSQPYNNLTPYLTVNTSIALSGIFPSRN